LTGVVQKYQDKKRECQSRTKSWPYGVKRVMRQRKATLSPKGKVPDKNFREKLPIEPACSISTARYP
jgi:hypothetical protein